MVGEDAKFLILFKPSRADRRQVSRCNKVQICFSTIHACYDNTLHNYCRIMRILGITRRFRGKFAERTRTILRTCPDRINSYARFALIHFELYVII